MCKRTLLCVLKFNCGPKQDEVQGRHKRYENRCCKLLFLRLLQPCPGTSPHFSCAAVKEPEPPSSAAPSPLLFTAVFASSRPANHLISIRAAPFTLPAPALAALPVSILVFQGLGNQLGALAPAAPLSAGAHGLPLPRLESISLLLQILSFLFAGSRAPPR